MRATADSPILPSRPTAQRGFTLIEIVVSIIVFGILMALLINVFAPNVVRGTDPLYSVRAAELGQSYLDEIIGKRFAENSPPGNGARCGEGAQPACTTPLGPDGETRANFDDADDYNGLDEPSATNSGGAVRLTYTNFRVQIVVAYAGADLGVTNTAAKLITVRVTAPNGGGYVFAAYKANF